MWRRVLAALHAVVWALACTALILCIGGALTLAVSWRRFPAHGGFYEVEVAGATVRMQAWCQGPPPSAAPTIFLDFGGGGHSSSDVYGLADALVAAGRRVCSADPPGTGWTALGSADTTVLDVGTFWSLPLLAAMGEPGPFVLIGSMDGGASRIYLAALATPAAVAALVPMQYGLGEFINIQAFRGWGDAQAQAYAASTLAGRLALCDAIRFLGTTWGVVGLVVGGAPPPGYTPADTWAEKNFLNLMHEGQWDLQCRMLADQVRNPEKNFAPDPWTANRSLASHIRVLALDNPPADPCAYSPSPDDCALQHFSTARNSHFMRNMTTMTPGSAYLRCDACPGSWLGAGDSNLPWITASVIGWL